MMEALAVRRALFLSLENLRGRLLVFQIVRSLSSQVPLSSVPERPWIHLDSP